MVEESLWKSTQALIEGNSQLVQEVIEEDQALKINREQLVNQTLTLIAREHPIATDLQNLMAGIEVIFELDRMGSYCLHLAKAVKALGTGQRLFPSGAIREIAETNIFLLREALTAHRHPNHQNDEKTAQLDEKNRKQIKELRAKLIMKMKENPENIDQCMIVYPLTSSLLGFNNRALSIKAKARKG